mgnify:CR=1 FL=1
MGQNSSHKCKEIKWMPLKGFDASAILGSPFKVILQNGVHAQVCTECGAEQGHVLDRPRELIAATAILRAFEPSKLNGAEIKYLRKTLGLKAKELASEISVTPETLSRFENNKQPISESAEKLLRAAVCLRHVDEAKGLNVNIAGLTSMKIPSVWDSSKELVLDMRIGEPCEFDHTPIGETPCHDLSKWGSALIAS